MRHVARSHGVNLQTGQEPIWDPAMFVRHVRTDEQLANMFAGGSFFVCTMEVVDRNCLLSDVRTIMMCGTAASSAVFICHVSRPGGKLRFVVSGRSSRFLAQSAKKCNRCARGKLIFVATSSRGSSCVVGMKKSRAELDKGKANLSEN